MQVGFGTGQTGHIVSLYPVQEIDGIEISPEVIRAGIYFRSINGGIFENPIFHKVIMDGRNYAMLTRKVYDIIMNDSIHPNVSNNASLYTVDYFRYCRSKLADDGVMSSWFPLFGLPLRDFKIIIKSFQTVFPHCSVWIANNCLNRHALLVGWKKDAPFQIDFAQMKRRLKIPDVKTSLADIHMDDVYALLDAFVLDENAVRAFTQGIPVHSDDHPILEFDAPRVEGSDEAVWARNLESTLAYRTPVAPHLTHIAESGENPDSVLTKLARFYRASTHVWKGQIHAVRQEHLQARQEYWKALQINPEDKDAAYLIRYDRDQEKVLAEQLHANPANWQIQVQLGLSLLGEGKLNEAEIHLKKALAVNPKSAEAHANLGLVHLYRKNWGAAIRELKQALALDPTLTEAQYNLGFAYLGKDGAYPKAATAWEKAVQIDPLYTSAHFNLGLAYWKMNRIPEAVAQFRTVLSQNPSDADAHKFLGKLLILDGKRAEARRHLNTYLRLQPDAKDRPAIEKLLKAIG
jgi:tetratricopeptide (TPR) repeat protein